MLSRILIAAGLAGALAAGGALAFLRTDFVANNLCSYAVATIEEATAAEVRVARCSVEPAAGSVTIEGLEASDPAGRIDLKISRVFVQVMVRPLMQRLRLERLEIDHPELHLALDQQAPNPPPAGGPAGRQCIPDVLDRFELGRVTVRKASVEVKASGVRVAVPRVNVAIKGKSDVLQLTVATRAGIVELPGRTVGLVSTRTAATVDLRGKGTIELEKADLIANDVSAFVSGKLVDLCAPRIEANANVRVDDLAQAAAHLAPGRLRGVSGGVSVDANVALGKGEVRAKGDLRLRAVALGAFIPGDAALRFDFTPARVKVDRLDVPVLRGAVTGTAEIGFESGMPLTADLSLRDVELAEVLRRVGLTGSHAVLRNSGRIAVRGQLSPFQLAGDVALDFADFAVLDRSFEQRAKAVRAFEMPRGNLRAALAIDPERVVLRNADIGTGRSHVAAEVTFFTDARRGMQITASGQGVDLADFNGHFGPLSAGGTVSFAARVAGPYAALSIDGTAEGRDLRFVDLALGDVAMQVGFQVETMALVFDRIRARRGRSSYGGRIAIDFSGEENPLDAHLEIGESSAHDLIALATGLVPALSPLADAEDVDGNVSGVIDVRGPAAEPDGTATLKLSALRLWGQRFDDGVLRASLHGREPRLQVEELALSRADDARFVLAGRFGPAWQLDFAGHTERFSLSDLDPANKAKLSGPLAASVRVTGVAEHPLVETTVKFFEAKSGKAALGDGELTLSIDGKKLRCDGSVGTHALHAEATLEGEFPYTARASLRIPDLRPVLDVFAPDADIQSGSLQAGLEAKGSLLRLAKSTGAITLSQLKVVRREMTFDNDGAAQLTFGEDGVQIRHLLLRAPYTAVELKGSRAPDGRLDVHLNASIDGRILEALVPDVEHASGTWLAQAAVSGTSQTPTVLGNLRVEDGEVRLRGFPVAARELNGSISFSQDALVIDSMTAKLNNGEARVSGGMEMTRLQPKRIDMAAHVTDVNVRLQDNLGATLDGDVTLYGPPLEPVLGGSLIVSRMTYTEDLDLEKSLLDFSRRPPSPRVLTKSPVVVHFDLDVHLSRGVRVENNLARTDLKGDLKVTGTSRAVGLLGSINTFHGTASFRGNEFQIDQGVVTFTDRQRIRPSFDLQASSQVKEYKVRLHAFGTPAEPHVALSSDPALAEADLGFLLTFGFVSQNLQQANFGAADSGLAIGVEALNKVTGFSEEVRRFIPKNAILRDPNIDFASDFSVATNRLEPMARFRSHLLNDHLDLRVLEGLTTRRYRGVVSYQLSDALSTRFQLDNEHLDTGTGTDFGIDLHLKWEGE